jgi:hypothetical protein
VIEVSYETHRAVIRYEGDHPEINQAVYLATPQQAVSAQELSDEQIQAIHLGLRGEARNVITFARAVLAKANDLRDRKESHE